MNEATTVVEVLRAARWILEHCGWRQCEYGQGKGPFCASGAIRKVIVPSESGLRVDSINALHSMLRDPRIAEWNDAPGRTKDEVLALFDRAIAEAEKKS